jgi:acyl-CoA hydrolase
MTAATLNYRSVAEITSQLKPGMTVFVPGVSGESLPFFEELRRQPTAAAGVTFAGVHFPGINQTDYLGLHPTSRQRAYFMSPAVRSGMATGRADLLPLDYPGIVRDLESNVVVDIAIAQVSPPDKHGVCSLGASYDFTPSVWNAARLRIAHVNPGLPRTRGSFSIRAQECHLAFEAEADIPSLPPETGDDVTRQLAKNVAAVVCDGDTLQLGVGRVQAGILAALVGHRKLNVYSGMISSAVAGLIDVGAIKGVRAIEAGVALGDRSFYQRLNEDETFYFRPARETHDIRRIACIHGFCAINSAVSVDLSGEVNADWNAGRIVAGAGGLPAFAAGARLASGGKSIIALPATAAGGKVSRITAQPEAGQLTTLARHEADFVITEFGVADLRARSIHGRARALIDIAAPQFRDRLDENWNEIGRRL